VGFIKLLIYFHFGEEISSAYTQLKNNLEEICSIIQLSNEEWKQWIAIKELEKQFDLSVFKALKLRRANLLAIGAFLLQYLYYNIRILCVCLTLYRLGPWT
jgi:hypothetical protein